MDQARKLPTAIQTNPKAVRFEAAVAWLEAAQAAGRSIPEATPPQDDSAFSGRFLVRLPRRLHAELARSAKREGLSLNQYVLFMLAGRQAEAAKAGRNTA